MAITIGTHVSSNAEAASSVTTSAITITAGSGIIVGTLNYHGAGTNSDAATPITDSGAVNAYTKIGSSSIINLRYAELFYAKNVTGGSLTFTYTVAAGDYPRIFVLEVKGLDTTAPYDVSSFGGSTPVTSFTTTGVATGTADEILVAICGDANAADAQTFANGGCATNTGAWTIDETKDATGNGLSGSLAHSIVTSTGTYCVTLGCTGAATDMMGGMATFKAAAGGAVVTVQPPMRTLRGAGV